MLLQPLFLFKLDIDSLFYKFHNKNMKRKSCNNMEIIEA